jgi:ADP-heptose:LPS heptosyltransferase
MKLVTLQEPISFAIKRSSGEYRLNLQAYQPYVLSNAHFRNIFPNIEKMLFKVSDYGNRLPAFHVHALKPGDKVLYFDGSGGFGDQIMAWPCAKILHRMGFEVHVATEPGLELCWWNFPWVKSIITLPIGQGQLEMWKNMILMDSVVNFDEHQDQRHPVDNQLIRFGIDPDSIDPEMKKVAPVFTQGEVDKAKAIIGDVKKFAIYQLAATSPTRTLQPVQSVGILQALAERFKDTTFVAIYDCFIDENLVKMAKGLTAPNIKVMTFPELRVLWATAASAAVCIGPDSMMLHVAGSMNIPSIGFWGLMRPKNRIGYYKNHIPIWHQNKCQFSPCFVTMHSFPAYCPPLPEPRTQCAVLGAIDPEEVCQAAAKFL